ncbi:thiamine phosphate synthase [Aurantimonas sp. VKM B-3413]|uniref:thiamine phosphate synthase n=1 Tax=Aurantimonas sp. VKM B-3413 TaxID=2779401 RepID=UPI001E58B7D4|nr:thiamine phosphate synthase [Aurantimonas sp. VKM B-3413]MCB8839526.1 thiamine phosphate synthase [Aurantimonas sp. VKM B-3413]
MRLAGSREQIDPFYPIVPSADWVARLVPLGVRLIQLRVKDGTEAEIRAEIRRARGDCAAQDCVLVVNDHWRLAIEEGCGFVHLGQEDLDTADVPAIRAAGLSLGLSTHDHEELARALAFAPDYVALGPVYPTTLKAMRFAPQGLERVTEWKHRIGPIPLVAIGGFTLERTEAAFAAGADIVSVVSDIVGADDPEARTREWLAATRADAACG